MLMRRLWVYCAGIAIGGFAANLALAKTPTAAEALRFKPVQEDVDFDVPSSADIEKCRIDTYSQGKTRGFVVFDENNQILRRFLDTDANNSIDQWCYFKNGIEVYRDIDSDGNGKADQYRWYGTAGIRWGIDRNEDNQIDSWQQISAEEVTEEIVAAVRNQDQARFERVLLNAEELKSLDLAEVMSTKLSRSVADGTKDFPDILKKQKVITSESKWVSFGGGKPGAVPGSKADVVVYDNVAAVVENDKKHVQIPIGTLVKVGEGWRVIDAPRALLDETGATPLVGTFFQAPLATGVDDGNGGLRAVNPALQKLVGELETLDKELAGTTDKTKLRKLHTQRAEAVEQIIDLAEGDDKDTWLRQHVETVTAAVQMGVFPEGQERLQKLMAKLSKQQDREESVVFLGYRLLQVEYTQSLEGAKDSEIPKIHAAWMEGLETLVKQHSNTAQAAEPILALAQEYEISGKEDTAIEWYGKLVKGYPDSEFARKANGGRMRLQSIGNRWMISGPTIDGKGTLNPSALAGKVVVVQYWATWCDQCKKDFSTLKSLQAKYGKQGFQVVSVNLDIDRNDALKVLKTTPLPWPTLYEPGGFEGRFANEMGVFTLPLTILVDQQGKVVSRNITVDELDAEVKKLLK